MARKQLTDEERKARALAYSKDRGDRLVALGACRMCGRHKETGEKISLREQKEKAAPKPAKPTPKPKATKDTPTSTDPFAGSLAEQKAAAAKAAKPKAAPKTSKAKK